MFPLAKVEIGCLQTGVYIVDDTQTQVLGIPWLTVIQDLYSGYIIGIHLSLEEPSIKTMALAIENAIERKDWLTSYEHITNEWYSFGIPYKIICPKKYNIESICNLLGIELDQNITRKMNRWFKTIKDDLFCRLPGNNLITKKDKRYKPEKKAIFTIESLKEIILLWIIDVYHNSYHSGIFSVPSIKFQEGINNNPPSMPKNPQWKQALHKLFESSILSDEVEVNFEDITTSLSSTEIESFREYYYLGCLAAMAKHQIMVKVWNQQLANENSEGLVSKVMFTKTHGFVRNLAELTKMDSYIYRIAAGEDIILNFGRIKQYLISTNRKENQWDNILINDWIDFVETSINDIKDLPQNFLKHNFRYDLPYVYNEEYTRLCRRVGYEEVINFLNKNSLSKSALPLPVERIDNQYIWTLGQLEIITGKYNKSDIFRHQFPLPFTCSHKFGIEVIEESNEPGETIYDFKNNSYRYYSDLAWELYKNRDMEICHKIADYIFKRVVYAPEIEQILGYKYLKLKNLHLAEEYLLKAISIYESVLGEDFEGKIFESNHDEYHFGLIYLGYISLTKNNKQMANMYFKKAAEVVANYSLNFEELIENFETMTNNEFILWFKTEFIDC